MGFNECFSTNFVTIMDLLFKRRKFLSETPILLDILPRMPKSCYFSVHIKEKSWNKILLCHLHFSSKVEEDCDGTKVPKNAK